LTPRPDIISAIVYAATATDVRTSSLTPHRHARKGITDVQRAEVIADASRQAELLFQRAGVGLRVSKRLIELMNPFDARLKILKAT
jgi:hypothetical protein